MQNPRGVDQEAEPVTAAILRVPAKESNQRTREREEILQRTKAGTKGETEKAPTPIPSKQPKKQL